MPTLETNRLLAAAVDACDSKKAEDVRILALDPSESSLTDYFLICSGTNERQNGAIADEIEYRLKQEFGVYANSVEGRRQGEWILLDYVDFVVHIFMPEKRAFYGLERLRKSAKPLTLDELNEDIKAAIESTRAKTTATKVPAKKRAAAKSSAETKTSAPIETSAPTKRSAAKDGAAGKQAAKKAAGAAPGTPRAALSQPISPAKKAVQPRQAGATSATAPQTPRSSSKTGKKSSTKIADALAPAKERTRATKKSAAGRPPGGGTADKAVATKAANKKAATVQAVKTPQRAKRT